MDPFSLVVVIILVVIGLHLLNQADLDRTTNLLLTCLIILAAAAYLLGLR